MSTETTNLNANADPINTEQRILELCSQNPDGITDAILQKEMPFVTPPQRVAAINRLLSLQKLDLLKSAQLGIVYRLKDKQDPSSFMNNSNELEEKIVYTAIKEAGNKGIWYRDIGTKTNMKTTALSKALKSLESKKLVKSVTSVASKKKVYMLSSCEPDLSVSGGPWYSDKEFESEFVEILIEQSHHYLLNKKEQQEKKSAFDPVLSRNASFATSREVSDYIQNLGISKVQLTPENMESILNTLVYEGKAERSVLSGAAIDGSNMNIYKALNPILEPKHGSAFVRIPCGICPVIDECHPNSHINPQSCVYMKEWLEF